MPPERDLMDALGGTPAEERPTLSDRLRECDVEQLAWFARAARMSGRTVLHQVRRGE